MSSNNCTNCGSTIKPGTKFCTSCGSPTAAPKTGVRPDYVSEDIYRTAKPSAGHQPAAGASAQDSAAFNRDKEMLDKHNRHEKQLFKARQASERRRGFLQFIYDIFYIWS